MLSYDENQIGRAPARKRGVSKNLGKLNTVSKGRNRPAVSQSKDSS